MRTRSEQALGALALAFVFWGAPALAEDRLLIAQPGFPGSTEEAREFVRSLCAAVSAGDGPALAGGEYHNDEKAALESVERSRPSVGIVSLGFFLEHREKLGLKPLLWTQPDEPYHLVALKDGDVGTLDDLAGKSVTGTALVEPRFVERVLFPDGAASGWKREPAQYFSRALRDVTRGRKEAALLSDRELAGMKRLSSASKLQVVHSTKPLPVAIVVAFGDEAATRLKGKLAVALAALSERKEGKELLETMGITSFAEVDAKRLEGLESQYRGAK